MPTFDLALVPFAQTRQPRPGNHLRSVLIASTAAAVAFALSGCAISRLEPASASAGGVALRGVVHGGQQPVSGSTIQLYAAGTAGNASAATPLLTAPVVTDASGGFNISGDYTCPSASTQVYLTATGGNPGLSGNVNNSSLALVAALGNCGSLASVQSISMNELTTVAAAWALAPFTTSLSNVGASSTNQAGLANAMQTAMMLADSYTGVVPGAGLPANATIESAKLVTLADIIADCVNSDGGRRCLTIFGHATPASGSSSPSDTFQAALSIVQNPGHNVTAIYNDTPATPAFGGALATAPNDWTMSIGYTGGGMQSPDSVSVDAIGNVWVASYTGALSGFAPSGAPFWGTAITGGGLSGTTGVVVDTAGNIWASNSTNTGTPNLHGSITQMAPSGQFLTLNNGNVSGTDFPVGLSVAPNGQIWIVNQASATVSLLDNAGNPISHSNGFDAGVFTNPVAVAANQFSNAWVADEGAGALIQIDSTGNVLRNVHCCAAPDSIALDAGGGLWIGDSTNNTLTQLQSNGIPVTTLTGFTTPRSAAGDSIGQMFVAASGSNSILVVGDSTSANPGVLVSPAAGYGLDASMHQPTGTAVDATGSLWVTSYADNRLVRFVGAAGPVQTPHIGLPVQP